ncbi:ADP-ribosyltransferase [Nocardiopsis lucentensis]|uniref:ADP-ribosyltransferase n=1 Tax=Nocardiopsis lucentensis TaxID=53441 RepID=UPI000345926A|nr:ADP-ribosyltransferase [Nocardiopsis lucentensis]
MRRPTVADIQSAFDRRHELTNTQQVLVRDITGFAPTERERRLAYWLHQAGAAGRLSDSFGRFPTVGDILDRARLMDEAVRGNRLPEPLTVHQGLRDISFMTGYDPNDLDRLVGSIRNDPTFLSTSLGTGVETPGWPRHPFQLHLTLPSGTHGLWLGGHTGAPGNTRTLLLPRDTRYRITGVRTEGTGSDRIVHLDATVLPPEPDSGGDQSSPSTDVDGLPGFVGEGGSARTDSDEVSAADPAPDDQDGMSDSDFTADSPAPAQSPVQDPAQSPVTDGSYWAQPSPTELDADHDSDASHLNSTADNPAPTQSPRSDDMGWAPDIASDSESGAGTQAGPSSGDHRPGTIGADGVRRFDSDGDGQAYGATYLDDPDRNPHAFEMLPQDQQGAIDGYVIRDRAPYDRILRAPNDQARQQVLQELMSDRGVGIPLYELARPHLRPPTMADIVDAYDRRNELTDAQRIIVHNILTAGDPAAALTRWRGQAGYAGQLIDAFGRVPTLQDITHGFDLIDQAIDDNPLPEPLLVHPNLHGRSFLAEYDPDDPSQLVGTVQTDPAYLLTSLGAEVEAPGAGHTPFRLHLTLPDGTHGLWLGGHTGTPGNTRTLLLPRNTRYQITGVRTEPSATPAVGGRTSIVHIDAEVLPPAPGNDGDQPAPPFDGPHDSGPNDGQGSGQSDGRGHTSTSGHGRGPAAGSGRGAGGGSRGDTTQVHVQRGSTTGDGGQARASANMWTPPPTWGEGVRPQGMRDGRALDGPADVAEVLPPTALSDEQASVVGDFTSPGGDTAVNDALRGGTGPEGARTTVETLDGLIDQSRVFEPVLLNHRTDSAFVERLGASLSDPESMRGLIGRTFTEPGYVATTATTPPLDHRNPVDVVIRVPEGYPALKTAGSSGPRPGEGPDVVLRRGATFVVHDVRPAGDELYDNDHWTVEVEVVPDGWTPPADWRSAPHGDASAGRRVPGIDDGPRIGTGQSAPPLPQARDNDDWPLGDTDDAPSDTFTDRTTASPDGPLDVFGLMKPPFTLPELDPKRLMDPNGLLDLPFTDLTREHGNPRAGDLTVMPAFTPQTQMGDTDSDSDSDGDSGSEPSSPRPLLWVSDSDADSDDGRSVGQESDEDAGTEPPSPRPLLWGSDSDAYSETDAEDRLAPDTAQSPTPSSDENEGVDRTQELPSGSEAVPGTDTQVRSIDVGNLPGTVGPDGVRRFGTDQEGEDYGEGYLDDPGRNPHAFENLPSERQEAVYAYSVQGDPYNRILRAPDHQSRQRILDHYLVEAGPGFSLYELTGPEMRPPTLEDVGHAHTSPDDLTDQQRAIVGDIMTSRDPDRTLTYWTGQAGFAGRLSDSFGRFPTVEDILARIGIIDQVIGDNPLPEPLATLRGLKSISFMNGYNRDNLHDLVGTVQTEPGYLSTSLGATVQAPGLEHTPYHLHLPLPHGTRGFWLGSHSAFPDQRELLLPRGIQYVITGVRSGGEGDDRFLHIDAEVLLPAPPHTDGDQDDGQGDERGDTSTGDRGRGPGDASPRDTGQDTPAPESRDNDDVGRPLGDRDGSENGTTTPEDTAAPLDGPRDVLDLIEPPSQDPKQIFDPNGLLDPPFPGPVLTTNAGSEGPTAPTTANDLTVASAFVPQVQVSGPDGGTGSGPDASSADVNNLPGTVGPDGVRRFATDQEGESYGENFLDAAGTVRHTFLSLPEETQDAVYGYTFPDSDPYNRILRAPNHQSREEILEELGSRGRRGPGFVLYEMTGPDMRPPTMRDIEHAHHRRDDLTEDQQALVNDIMGSAAPSERLDYWMRHSGYAGRLSDSFGHWPTVGDILHRIGRIDEAIGRSPLPEPLLAHRGLFRIDFMNGFTASSPENPDYLDNLRNLIGTVQTEPGYLSTTLGAAAQLPGWRPMPFEVHLILPDGTHGFWLGGHSAAPEQRELLLPRDTQYMIRDVTRRADGTIHFDADVIVPVAGGAPGGMTGPRPLSAFTSLPGTVGDDGVRRFASAEEGARYGDELLDDPRRNPGGFQDLTIEQQGAVRQLLKEPRPYNEMSSASNREAKLDLLRDWFADRGEGWPLYEMTMAGDEWIPPTYFDIDDAAQSDLPPAQRAMVDDILSSPDPDARIAELLGKAGFAGHLVDAFGHFPSVEEFDHQIGLIDQALNDTHLPESILVHPDLDSTDFLRGFDPGNPQAFVGTVQTAPGYLFTMLGAHTPPGSDPAPFRLHLTLPAGARGLWVEGEGGDPDQQKLLLPRDSQFTIMRVTKEDDGTTHIDAVVLVPAVAPGSDNASGPDPATVTDVTAGPALLSAPESPDPRVHDLEARTRAVRAEADRAADNARDLNTALEILDRAATTARAEADQAASSTDHPDETTRHLEQRARDVEQRIDDMRHAAQSAQTRAEQLHTVADALHSAAETGTDAQAAHADQLYQQIHHLLPPPDTTTHAYPVFPGTPDTYAMPDMDWRADSRPEVPADTGTVDPNALTIVREFDPGGLPGTLGPDGVRRFTTDEAGERYGERFLSDPHRNQYAYQNLADEHQRAVYGYTWPSSKPYNGMLRAGNDAERAELLNALLADPRHAEPLIDSYGHFPSIEEIYRRIGLVDHVIDNSPVPEPLLVHRGLSTIHFMHGVDRHNLQALVGTIQTEPGYLSTSLGAGADMPGWPPVPVQLHLTLPAGAKAFWLGRHSAVPDQRELLLPRNTRYQITKVTMDDEGTLHIDADVLVPAAHGAPDGTDLTVLRVSLPEPGQDTGWPLGDVDDTGDGATSHPDGPTPPRDVLGTGIDPKPLFPFLGLDPKAPHDPNGLLDRPFPEFISTASTETPGAPAPAQENTRALDGQDTEDQDGGRNGATWPSPVPWGGGDQPQGMRDGQALDGPAHGTMYLALRMPPPAMTPRETSVVRDFTGNGGGIAVNDALRHGSGPEGAPERIREAVDILDTLIDHSAAPDPLILHQRADTAFTDLLGASPTDPDSMRDLIGRTYTDPGFTSTTTGEPSLDFRDPVDILIRVPQGYPALNTSDLAGLRPGDGPDVVLRRGSTFVVHDVRPIRDELYDNDHWVVEAEVVPDGWTPPADWRSDPRDGEGGLPPASDPAPITETRGGDQNPPAAQPRPDTANDLIVNSAFTPDPHTWVTDSDSNAIRPVPGAPAPPDPNRTPVLDLMPEPGPRLDQGGMPDLDWMLDAHPADADHGMDRAVDPPPGASPDALPGTVHNDGVRRFTTNEEGDRYGNEFLDDPQRNPHSFRNLTDEQRFAVVGYTRVSWPYNDILRAGDDDARRRVLADWTRGDVSGWPLDELTGPLLSPPTLNDVVHAAGREDLNAHQWAVVHDIVNSPDPGARLAELWGRDAAHAEALISAVGRFSRIEDVELRIGLIDQALERSVLPEPVLTHRGLESIGFLDGFDPDNLEALIGTIQTELGYMSTSLGAEAAPPSSGHARIHLHLTLPAGARGLWLGGNSSVPAQRELLLPRGTRYVITGVTRSADGTIHIDAGVLVPTDGRAPQGTIDPSMLAWPRT